MVEGFFISTPEAVRLARSPAPCGLGAFPNVLKTRQKGMALSDRRWLLRGPEEAGGSFTGVPGGIDEVASVVAPVCSSTGDKFSSNLVTCHRMRKPVGTR